MKSRMKRIALVIGALFAAGILTGTAAAVLGASAGGAQLRVDKRTNNAPSTTKLTRFVDLPGVTLGSALVALAPARLDLEPQRLPA
jgi:hypothetical protein